MNKFINLKKGQGSLEYLLIIGGAVLIAIIVLALVVGVGGHGRTDAKEQTQNSQVALDSSTATTILNVYPKECASYQDGNIQINFNQISNGSYYVVILDYDNKPISLIGTDANKIPAGSTTYNVSVNLAEKNLACGDTFWAKIISYRNGKEVKSNLLKFRWDVSSIASVYFTGGPSGGIYNGTGNITYNAVLPSGATNIVWTLYSAPIALPSCNNQISCTIPESTLSGLANGTHYINIKADPSIDVNTSFIVNTIITPPPVFAGDIDTPKQDAQFNLDTDVIHFLAKYSNNTGNVNCAWASKLSTSPTWNDLEASSCDFQMPAKNMGNSGTYNIILTATDDKGSTFTKTISILIFKDGEFITLIGSPESGKEYSSSETISFLATDIKANPITGTCVWDSKFVKDTKWKTFNDKECKFDAPVNTIGTDGIYNIRLTATNEKNEVSTTQINITIVK